MFGIFKKSPKEETPKIYSEGELWWGLKVTNFEVIASNLFCPICQKNFEPGKIYTVLYNKTEPGFFAAPLIHFDCAFEKIKEAGEIAIKRRLEIRQKDKNDN